MSFVEVSPESDFSYQNLPYGIFHTPDNVIFFILTVNKKNLKFNN